MRMHDPLEAFWRHEPNTFWLRGYYLGPNEKIEPGEFWAVMHGDLNPSDGRHYEGTSLRRGGGTHWKRIKRGDSSK